MILPSIDASSTSLELDNVVDNRMDRKVEAVTGLRSAAANAMDVVDEIPGEHTDIHVDSVSNTRIKIKLGNLSTSLLCEGSQRTMAEAVTGTGSPL